MTSRETLECRIYMVEDAMFRRSGELNHRLHELESRLTALTEAIHHALCDPSRTPLETRAGDVVHAIEALEAGIDLGEIRSQTETIASLKGLIDGFQRELAERQATRSFNEGARAPRVQGGLRHREGVPA